MHCLFLILLIAVSLVVSSCQSAQTAVKMDGTPTPAPAPNNTNAHPDDGAPRISLADAKAHFDKGGAIFIDTRPEDTYKQEHVKGAINIALMDDASKYSSIPKGKKIIVYCS
jgi:hypothetical protein